MNGSGQQTTGEATIPAAGSLFVGREREVAQIGAALDDVIGGTGRLVVLAGEPGIGKTSLADRAMATASARGAAVFWGRCWEAGGAPAYWPWLDVLGGVAAGLDAETLRQVLGDGASLLAELVPEVRGRTSGAATDTAAVPSDEARFRLWRATVALLRYAARARPLGIVLDDLHAADRSSLMLLHFVARELRSMRVLLLVTYRDIEARMDAETSALVSSVGREGLTVTVPRLDREAATSIVRQRAGDVATPLASRIFERTQGNPLFLDEMLRLLVDQGADAIAAGVVPHGVRDVIRQRLDRIAGETRPLMDLAAVAGDEIDVPLLVAVSGEDGAVVSARLAEAARLGVLADRGGRRRFGHALFREVLYRELDDVRRRTLHGQIAGALERLHAHESLPYAELAHHGLEGPRSGLDRALEWSIRAAVRAEELLAYDDAIQVLTRACEAVAATGNSPALRARVMMAMGAARIRAGDSEGGKTACREAATIASAVGDAELAAQAALTYGRVFSFGSVDPLLVGMLEESLEALPFGDTALRARLLARLGGALQPTAHVAEPIAVAHEAIATAQRLGDPRTLLETMHDAISAMMDIADPREQRDLNLEVERLAESLGDRERLLRTLGRLALAHLALGDLDAADARIAAFESLAAELKAPWLAWRAGMLRAVRATMHGRFEEAAQWNQKAAAMGILDPMADRIRTSQHESMLRASERHEEMAAWDPEMRRARAQFQHGSAWQAMGSALTYARLEDEGKTRFHLDLLPDEFRPPSANLFWMFFVAEAVALVGPPAVAQKLHEAISRRSDEYVMLGMSYMSWDGPTTRLLALLAAVLGRWDEACARFEDAIARCRHLDAKPYLARTTYEYGRALQKRNADGDPDRARRLLTSALTMAEEFSLPGLVRLARARLETLGGSTVPMTVPTSETAPAPTIALRPIARGEENLPFTFALEGEYWTFAYEGTTFRLKDSLGLQYLVRLLRAPGQEIHVLDLAGERAAGAAHQAIDTGDAGELLDAEARAEYKHRLEDLREVLAEAESFGDAARAARAREEIEFLAAELGRAVGLGGRARRAGGAAERARSAVQRRIKNALERMGEHAPALAAYLGRTVRTGNFCVFRPESV